jgi:CheY-like chemotaxis protein
MDNNTNNLFLIVDDEPEICLILERILKKVGGICHSAHSAKAAISMAECHRYHEAFLDAKLPDLDGFELARCLRKSNPDLYIVIVSGYYYKDDQTILTAIESGLISAFIAKPFVHEEILNAFVNRQGKK